MRRIGRGALLVTSLVVAATMVGASFDTPVVTAVGGAPSARHVLYDGGSFYPRIIRLAHSGSADGTILVSVTTNIGNDGAGIIESSTDGGETFHQLATIRDPDAADGAGICCSSLFELPIRVGKLPAGTVLWADSVGYTAPPAHHTTRQRLWASYDHGATWQWLSDIAVAPNQYNTWEPSLEVDSDGSLVAFYSDETDKTRHDQKLVQVRSADGVTWTGYQETVVDDDWSVRPGMADTIQTPYGVYYLVYEVCNDDKVHLCEVYFRASPDGWNFGDPHDLGTEVRTANGRYPTHTPSVAWSPGPGPAGTILLVAEMLVNPDGSLAPDNGDVILTNDELADQPWQEIPAPIAISGVHNGGCKNFGSALLPSADGGSVLEVATDLDGSVCKTYYGTEPLPSTEDSGVGVAASPGIPGARCGSRCARSAGRRSSTRMPLR